MGSTNTKASPRPRYSGSQREGNLDECFYCHQKEHQKSNCLHFTKHQQELNGFKNSKPVVGVNAMSHVVCVMTRVQRTAADEGKKDSESEKNDDKDDSSSGSSEDQEDYQRKKGEENSDDEKIYVFEQDEHNNEGKENDDKPIGTNNDEWKADKEVHQSNKRDLRGIGRSSIHAKRVRTLVLIKRKERGRRTHNSEP